MTDDEKKMLKNMGALGYGPDKIISVMEIEDRDGFLRDWKDENSEVRRVYNSGADLADYKLDLKLFEMAQAGDLKAMDKLDIRKRRQK